MTQEELTTKREKTIKELRAKREKIIKDIQAIREKGQKDLELLLTRECEKNGLKKENIKKIAGWTKGYKL